MKILLLGKNGQVGWELQRSLSVLGEVIALDRNASPLCGDLTRLHDLALTVQSVRPDVIVNAAAYTAVDKAESEPDLAALINTEAPKLLAQEAAKLNALLVHFSTDYVFNGLGADPWVEGAATGPLSIYGHTKLQGEQAIQESGCKYLIFRTSWVYAAHGANFAKTMLRLAAEHTQLSVINDQYGAPTHASLLADVTAHAVRIVQKKPSALGIYHCVPTGETTWFDYASYVINRARELNVPLKVESILPVSTAEYPTPARRPLNSRLNTDKLQQTFDLTLPAWEQGVNRMLQEILEK